MLLGFLKENSQDAVIWMNSLWTVLYSGLWIIRRLFSGFRWSSALFSGVKG